VRPFYGADVNATTIKDYERGKRRISAIEMSVLRRVLEAAGIEFTNGDGSGVKLAESK
jgi:hypothetical protein